MKTFFTVILLLVSLGAASPPCLAALTHDNAAQRLIEEQALAWLEKTRNRPGTALEPFTSDGCSGGLSPGWKLLADSSARFEHRYGPHPPWEHCCTAHDRIYWQGETENGYRLRLEADEALRQCVIETGKQQSRELAPAFEMEASEVEELFRKAGDLMYVSVRLGGGPCSGLPWRWGYGWPQCGTSPSP